MDQRKHMGANTGKTGGIQIWRASKAEKIKKKGWEPEPLYVAIEAVMPHATELTIDAHRFVESELVPKFAAGMPVDIVQRHHTNQWDTDVQEHACSAHMHMCFTGL